MLRSFLSKTVCQPNRNYWLRIDWNSKLFAAKWYDIVVKKPEHDWKKEEYLPFINAIKTKKEHDDNVLCVDMGGGSLDLSGI